MTKGSRELRDEWFIIRFIGFNGRRGAKGTIIELMVQKIFANDQLFTAYFLTLFCHNNLEVASVREFFLLS